MIKRRIVTLLLLFVVTLIPGCQAKSGVEVPSVSSMPSPTATPNPVSPTPAPTQTPDPIKARMEEMTLQQKVGQLLIAGVEGLTPGQEASTAIVQYQVGGVILFGRNVESAPQLSKLTNDLKILNGDYIPLFMSVDEEGGRVSRMPPEVTDLPSAYQYTQEGGDAAARGRVIAAECAAFGFNVDFAPSLDIWSNPDNTVIGDRAFSRDWEQVEASAEHQISAMIEAGILPVVKHFPGHGDTTVDSHVGLPVVDKTVEELKQAELVPFQMLISGTSAFGLETAAPVPAVMVGHILMSAIDEKRPATLSHAVVTELLREDLGFGGVVFTDDLTMGAISNTYGMGEACVMAVEAGCDSLLVCHKIENLTAARDGLLAAVGSGRISQARLDESVYRILSLKAQYNLTNLGVSTPDVKTLNAAIQEILP